MATMNATRTRNAPRTHEGAVAKRIGDEAQLRRSVMSCLLWENEFYEDGASIAERIAEGVRGVPQGVASQIAIEAREQMHLRHVPLWIVREMARSGGKIVGDTLARVIQRADELNEFMAMYWSDGKTPLSAQVKRGLAGAFTKFDAYQLAKYDRAKEVRLRDVLFLCHAKPKDDEQATLWKSLVDGTMSAPDTWEVALSSGGDKKEHWTRLLRDGKMGGLALLRNLRNMEQANVDGALVRQAIVGANYRRVLPFRFIAAAKYAPSLEPELEEAMLRSLQDTKTLSGKTALLVDHSGSMRSQLSGRSEMTRFEVACGLAMLLREVCEQVDIVAFSAPIMGGYVGMYGRSNGGDRPAVALVPPRRGFALRDALDVATPWWGTNTEDGKRFCDQRGYDRLILITDEQSHQRISDPQGIGYVVNVASAKNGIGYGAWTHIDGWSESVVRYIQEIENGR